MLILNMNYLRDVIYDYNQLEIICNNYVILKRSKRRIRKKRIIEVI